MKAWLIVWIILPHLFFAQENKEMERVWKQASRKYTYEKSADYQGPKKETDQSATIESAPQQIGETSGESYTGIPFEEGTSGGTSDNGDYVQEGQSVERASGSSGMKIDSPNPYRMEGWNTSLSVIFVILLCVAVAFLAFWLLKNRQKSGNVSKKETTIENPAKVSLESLNDQLKEALLAEDYKGAVRIYLLFALKHLLEKQLVFWKRDKTNYHYSQELKGCEVAPYFINIARIYDQIWYGAQTIDKARFQHLQQQLESNYQLIIREK